MAKHEVRPAQRDDMAGVLSLYRQLNPDDATVEHHTAEMAWSALLSSDLTTVFVIDIGGVLVSSCTLAIVPNLSRGARPYGVIENEPCCMLPSTGHGAANCYKVLLATGSQRESTLRFYEGAGFQRGGKTYFEIRRA